VVVAEGPNGVLPDMLGEDILIVVGEAAEGGNGVGGGVEGGRGGVVGGVVDVAGTG
jgi:hypothetical protein